MPRRVNGMREKLILFDKTISFLLKKVDSEVTPRLASRLKKEVIRFIYLVKKAAIIFN
jgi:hypothetical protein